MTGPSTGYRRYDDEEFLAALDVYDQIGDEWIGTATIAKIIGCGMGTANRRLLALAHETDIEVYDPTVGEGEAVAPDSFDDPPTRLLGFRREPEDPESAPDVLHTTNKTL